MKSAILIPTYNAGGVFEKLLQSVNRQNHEVYKKIIIDSGSTDDTPDLARHYGFEVIKIDKSAFDHGGTRQQLADQASDCDLGIFLTQDCILFDQESIGKLIHAFDNAEIGMAYGRQLPHMGAKLLESHARLFNYNEISEIRSIDDAKRLGIKTISFSNSFSAYRLKSLKEVGGFPEKTIMGEDVLVAAAMVKKGLKIAYVAEAVVYHSHDYTLKEEFKRYFDIGVFHKQYHDLIKTFGKATGEGKKYAKSEVKYVAKNNPLYLYKVFLSLLSKWIGYKMGMKYETLPRHFLTKFSMQKKYWDQAVKK